MNSLAMLAIAAAFGLFFEPGWRLHPGARAKMHAEHGHGHGHEHGHEHAGHAEHAENEEGVHGEEEEHAPPPAPAPGRPQEEGQPGLPQWLVGAGAAIASWGAWLHTSTGIEVMIPYVLLGVTVYSWWRFEHLLTSRVPTVPPISPLAPKLELNDADGPEAPPLMPIALTVFFFGIGLGLAVARRIYSWGNPEPPLSPQQPAPAKVSGAVEAKRAPPPRQEMHKTGP